jgi:hypothetical protein
VVVCEVHGCGGRCCNGGDGGWGWGVEGRRSPRKWSLEEVVTLARRVPCMPGASSPSFW